jgi:hypothetical protein
MLRNTMLSLPDDLIARVESYAAAHGTTMTAIIEKYLETVASDAFNPVSGDPLRSYSQGRLSINDAIRLLGLRDYAELLVTLGDADLPMPLPRAHDVDNQAVAFAKLWTGQ